MKKLDGILGYVSTALQALGGLIDKLVPFGVGSRTQIAVVACPFLGVITPVLQLIPGAGPFVALVPTLQQFLCGTAVAFAAAGLVRPTDASK